MPLLSIHSIYVHFKQLSLNQSPVCMDVYLRYPLGIGCFWYLIGWFFVVSPLFRFGYFDLFIYLYIGKKGKWYILCVLSVCYFFSRISFCVTEIEDREVNYEIRLFSFSEIRIFPQQYKRLQNFIENADKACFEPLTNSFSKKLRYKP